MKWIQNMEELLLEFFFSKYLFIQDIYILFHIPIYTNTLSLSYWNKYIGRMTFDSLSLSLFQLNIYIWLSPLSGFSYSAHVSGHPSISWWRRQCVQRHQTVTSQGWRYCLKYVLISVKPHLFTFFIPILSSPHIYIYDIKLCICVCMFFFF